VSHIPGAQRVRQARVRSPPTSRTWPRSEGWCRTARTRRWSCTARPVLRKEQAAREELVAAGYTSVRRYQLGIPVWRALGGMTVIEPDALGRVFREDRTAVFIDVRSLKNSPRAPSRRQEHPRPWSFKQGRRRAEEGQGRRPPPHDDHNTRIIVVADSVEDAASSPSRSPAKPSTTSPTSPVHQDLQAPSADPRIFRFASSDPLAIRPQSNWDSSN